MDGSLIRRKNTRNRRVMRVRKKVRGTTERPRISVFKSNSHLYAQVIDDETGKTLFGIGTMSKLMKEENHERKSREAAKRIGTKLADWMKQNNILQARFDRGRYKYHGLIAEVAQAARESGLQI